MPDAGLVHLDADEVQLRVVFGLLYERVAVAKTDLEHPGCPSPEQSIEVQRIVAGIYAVSGPQFLQRALLRRRQATGAAHETPNRAPPPILGTRYLHRGILLHPISRRRR